jgi:hypothetical protein
MTVMLATSTWHCHHHWHAASQQQLLPVARPSVLTMQQLHHSVMHLMLEWVLLLLLALGVCCCSIQRIMLMTLWSWMLMPAQQQQQWQIQSDAKPGQQQLMTQASGGMWITRLLQQLMHHRSSISSSTSSKRSSLSSYQAVR